MNSKTIKVEEGKGGGTRGGPYVYLVNGLELVHISEYAIRKLPGIWKDQIIYELPSNIKGKTAYVFEFSRSGLGPYITKGRIEDIGNYNKCKHGSIEEFYPELKQLKFRCRSKSLKVLLQQFITEFVPIINDLKEFQQKLSFEYCFSGHQRRLENAFKNPEYYYFAYMCLPTDKSRIRSLKATRKWLYQLWVLKLTTEALKTSRFIKYNYKGKPYWRIEQGSEFSTTIGETPFGNITFWLEFQPSKYAHMAGEFTKTTLHVRPDCIVVKGHFDTTRDFIKSEKPIDMLIECKEDPFDSWKNDIESQIISYQEFFKPKHLLIACLEPVPSTVKRYYENKGIKIVDNLRPNSRSFENLYTTVWNWFNQ